MDVRELDDGDDLVPFLVAGMDWRDNGSWDAARVLADAAIAHYVEGWKRPGDAGVGAFDGPTAVAAAWWRTFTADDAGYGFVADDIPELSLAVSPAYRGRGAGSAVLDGLLALAHERRLRALSLSVEDGNDIARAMYERRGFRVVGRTGDSDTMLLELASA